MKKLFLASVMVAIQSCAPSSYIVKEPQPSEIKYANISALSAGKLIAEDLRANNEKFSQGTLVADLAIKKGELLEPVNFLISNTELELLSRGIPVSLGNNDNISVEIQTLLQKNHRLNGFAPFVTFTMLKSNIKLENKNVPVSVFVRRAKVPVWSFDEVIEPTLNEPLSILVKEFSAKLNSAVYGQKTSNEAIDKLVNKINAGGTYLDVYQLGFSNNLYAVEHLKTLTESDDEYKRQAAISSIGILKAKKEIIFLKSLYRDSKLWTDKAMALKAIGDLRIKEGEDFLREELKAFKGDTKKYWVEDLINLYI